MENVILIQVPKNKEIEKVRKKYDPNHKNFKPHISIVYPFPKTNPKDLDEHIKNSIKKIKPFKITLNGLKKSTKDYYLYLLVDKGEGTIKKLYKNLHRKLLNKYKNKDMPRYIPHITLGIFKTKKEIDEALKEIKKINLRLEFTLNKISLLTIDKNHKIKSTKGYKLK
ncbi:hypothetical protein CMI38_01325 [Candidatus Pacearchaeota archaeon]|nr:hypothetical protein [Candidatus Pacearchaeota archaeon]